jgi:8-amino-7-oxononanoate synthase
MNSPDDKLSVADKRARMKGIMSRAREMGGAVTQESTSQTLNPAFYDFAQDPGILGLAAQHAALADRKLENPFFKSNDGIAQGTTQIAGGVYINYANYNYLGLSGELSVSDAAIKAIRDMGTSVSASRIASGERAVQRNLETALAGVYDVEDAVVFVSGHATNVTTIGHLFGPRDLILYDELAHNSAIQGALLSGARRVAFPHNDSAALETLLAANRSQHDRVLIFIEGVYSMDGDIPDLPRFIALRNRYKTYLMVDEAHALGALGARGFGIREHFDLAGNEVDIWMGTLSKTLASCGGYIAGSHALVEYLKYSAPGFLFSVGITPPNAAASLAAIELMQAEPDRVTTLRARGDLFRELAKAEGLDIGLSDQSPVVPVIVKDSMLAVALSNALFAKGINVQPVLYPAVEEDQSRLRFFLSSAHTEDQIRMTVETISTELHTLRGA